MKIDDLDRAHIAYYSNTEQCLRMAWEPYSKDFAGRPYFAWSRLTPARSTIGQGVSLWVNGSDQRFAFSCVDGSHRLYLGEGAFRPAGRDGFAPYLLSLADVTMAYSIPSGPTAMDRDSGRCGRATEILFTDTNAQDGGLAGVHVFNATNPADQQCPDNGTIWKGHFCDLYRGDGHDVTYAEGWSYTGACWFNTSNSSLEYCKINYYGSEVVDGAPGSPVGRYCSLAYDRFGNPHISYQDISGTGALKYAFRNETGWHTFTIDSTTGAGVHTSIAVDSNGEPHISYSTEGQLKYASLNGTEWYTQVVDRTPTVWTSIDVDSKNRPHIAYYDSRKKDLRFAWWEPYIRGRPFPG
jgi:hypothetical protein